MIYGGPKKGLFLFDSNTRAAGGKNQHVVIIESIDGKPLRLPNGKTIENPRVVGYLKNDFTYSVDAEWSPVLDGFLNTDSNQIGKIAQLVGSPIFQSGVFKRKFYKGAGYLSFTIEMRIVSDAPRTLNQSTNGVILNPKTAVQYLSTLCLPDPDPILAGLGKVVDNVEDLGSAIKEEYNKKTEEFKKSLEGGTLIEDTIKKFGEFVGKQYPRTLRVKIGNYFDSSDMLIEKVTATYSKESIKSSENSKAPESTTNLENYQPLWVDLSITVSTKTIPTVDNKTGANTGLLTPQPSVSFSDEIIDGFNNENAVTGQRGAGGE